MKYVLDTNVVSDWSKSLVDQSVANWIYRQSPEDLAVSVLTVGEVLVGIELLPEGKRADRLWEWYRVDLPALIGDRILPVDHQIAAEWAALRAKWSRVGPSLSLVDSLILTTARVHGLQVVTRNLKDFGGLGVEIINPWDASP